MNKKINKIVKYLPFILFLLYVLWIHRYMLSSYGDDLWFANFKGQSLIDIAKNRYMTWTSRFILDTGLFLFNSYLPKLWLPLNIFFCVLIYYSLNKIVNPDNNIYIKYATVFLFMLYPFADLGSAGWVTTTIIYLWPLALGLYSFSVLIEYLKGKKIIIIKWILAFASLIIAVNHEQLALLSFGFLLVFIVYDIYKTKKIKKILLFYAIITLINLVNHLLCPGNNERLLISIATSFPDFNTLNIFEKFLLALNNTYEMILGQTNYIFIGLLFFMLYKSIKEKKKKEWIVFNIIMILGAFVIPKLNLFNMSKLYGGYLCPSGENCRPVLPILFYGSKKYIVSILLSTGYTFIMALLLFFFYKKEEKNRYLIPILFMAAILSRLVIGFSPTLYISGYRTGTFMYFLFAITILFLITTTKMNKTEWKYLIIFSIVLILFCHFIIIVPSFRL